MAAALSLPPGHDLADALIELSGVSKDYESGAGVVRALREVDLTIRRGEFVAIVGTSGSGKSTLMNILGCLDRPTRGTYRLAGLDAGNRTNDGRALVRNRMIGFIFQGFNLLPRTTALENCELPLQYRGVAAGARRKRALASLAQVNLADRVHHTPNQLSGGQQQRVAIARALVTDPPLLLADEPTGNLDTRTSLEVLALMQHINKESGITIILVTHEHDIAACASRVITVRDGRIVSDVVQATPLNAAKELADLPPPDTSVGNANPEAERDPLQAARARLGGPVPFMVFFVMFLGALLGAIVGLIYNSVVLAQSIGWITAGLSLLGESFVAARFARRRLGRPMTNDQRSRVALWYTVATAVMAAPILVWRLPKLPPAVIARFESVSSAAILFAALGAMALLRYLLLSLFSPKK